MRNITFIDLYGLGKDYAPRPATEYLPDWYKRTPEYTNKRREIVDGSTPHTIKKCIPVFDAMTAGYIIATPVDVQVTRREGSPYFEWPMLDAISFHPIAQALLHPEYNGYPYPKWSNPWGIQTPPGYSCMFLPPLHNPNGIFTAFPGIVDTDTYTAAVNFPFVLDDPEWTGLIPKGTPIVQVIPFRRDDWESQYSADAQSSMRVVSKLLTLFFNSYKRQFWTRKQYR